MKEELTKNLIKKSTINTSEDFTNKLLLKIEAEKAVEPFLDYLHNHKRRYAIMGTIGVGAVLLTLIYLGFLPKFSIFNFQFKISKTPLLVITTLLLLLGTNHILRIHHFSSFQSKN